MEERRCMGCMGLTGQPVCHICGYPQNGTNEPHQLCVGYTLHGQYTIGRVLGQGGFGITYLGWDNFLDIPVAIKEFYPNAMVNRETSGSQKVRCYTDQVTPQYLMSKERFLREAKALARFEDEPAIVKIRGFFEENDTAYIIMEYVRGTTLASYVQRRGGKLSAGETLRILKPIIEALAAVHEAGLVHRDISPDNVMLHPRGGAKLLDFGAVRSVENTVPGKDLARSTEAILKHGFAPMEQYQSRGGLGPWTDEYALCATIYYCLTGTIPAEAPMRMLEEIEIDWNLPGLNEQQKAALRKGMSLRAKDRHGSVRKLMEQLYEGEGMPIPLSQPVPASGRQPSQSMPASSRQPFQPIPASGRQPSQPIPASGRQPSQPIPASGRQPSQPIPVSGRQPSQPIPVSGRQPSQPIPASGRQPSQPMPASGRQPSQPMPASGRQPSQPMSASPVQMPQRVYPSGAPYAVPTPGAPKKRSATGKKKRQGLIFAAAGAAVAVLLLVVFLLLPRGWREENGGYCYYKNGVKLSNAWHEEDGNYYYFNSEGYMHITWEIIDGRKYYFGEDGIMVKNWQQIEEDRFYFGTDGVMVTGMRTIDGSVFYFEENGAMVTGWKKVNDDTYYFSEDGAMHTGWLTMGSKKYYFNEEGKMLTGTQYIMGHWYYFDFYGELTGK